MSWTKRQLVVGAFEELGLGASEFDIGPENLESGLRRLEIMMAKWNGEGIRIGFNNQSVENSDLSQNSNVPDWCIEAILVNLALKIAPMFGKMVTREAKVTAKDALDVVISRTSNQDPIQMEYPSSLPIGAGNRNYRVGNTSAYFPTPNKNIEAGPDGDLDFY